MSQSDKPFTKRQIQIIVKIAFLEAMLIVFALPSIQSTGEVTPAVDQIKELSLIQNGTATVTVSSGSTAGSTSITYPSAYTLKPILSLTTQAVLTTSITITIPNPTAFFQSGVTPATVWTNMPTTDNEIYGDTNGEHRIELNLSGMSTFRFGVNCITPSNTAGAYLTIDYLNGVTWTEMNSAQRFLIDNSNGACPAVPFTDRLGSTTYATIPVGAKTTITQLRIDGVGGGGLGDIPSFTSFWIEWSTSATGNSQTTIPMTGQWRACATLILCTTPLDTLKTGFVIQVLYPLAVTSTQTLRFTWSAGVII